jgi:SET domain-containing protein
MFRITDDMIVDSTKRGNTSRFINHSCDPNCYTKVITVDGEPKIVVFANKFISRGTEITYNYFFSSEEERLACNCGSLNCAGRLN